MVKLKVNHFCLQNYFNFKNSVKNYNFFVSLHQDFESFTAFKFNALF